MRSTRSTRLRFLSPACAVTVRLVAKEGLVCQSQLGPESQRTVKLEVKDSPVLLS